MISSKEVPPRNRNELEGTLLPPPSQSTPIPHATQIIGPLATGAVEPSAPPMASSAIPITHFEYDASGVTSNTTENAAPAVGDDNYYDEGIQTAPFLPRYEDSSPPNRARVEDERVKIGNTFGRILSGEEKDGIRKAGRHVYSTQYHTDRAVEDGNRNARMRDREGVQLKEDKYYRLSNLEAARKNREKEVDPDVTSYKKKGGGYEISEYEVSEYSGREYDVNGYEYKSVYDE